MVEFLVKNWSEVLILATVGSAFAGWNYKFRRSIDRHDETKAEIARVDKSLNNRVEKHEDTCAERYDRIDTGMSGIHEKINRVAEDVATIKGALGARK